MYRFFNHLIVVKLEMFKYVQFIPQHMTNLSDLIKEKCMGVYFGAQAEAGLGYNTAFGFRDSQNVINLCMPTENFSNSWFSLSYWTRPNKEVKALLDCNPEEMRKKSKLLFFHYLLDKNIFRRNALAHNKRYKNMPPGLVKQIDLSSEDVRKLLAPEVVSCIYGNFLGETIYVGDVAIMQELVDKIKTGFESAQEILGQLTRASLVESEIKRVTELTVHDLVKWPELSTISNLR